MSTLPLQATNYSTTVADEVDGDAASAHADDVNDNISEDGSALGTPRLEVPNTIAKCYSRGFSIRTALSPSLQQSPSDVAEGVVGSQAKRQVPKRVAQRPPDNEQRLLKYKSKLQSAEQELVKWQKTRIVYKALRSYYRQRHEEDKFTEKVEKLQEKEKNLKVVADLWHLESVLVSVYFIW